MAPGGPPPGDASSTNETVFRATTKVSRLRDKGHGLPYQAQGLEWTRPATGNLGVALVLWFGGSRGCLRLMVMPEYFSNSPACALGDFACALGRTHADVLAGDSSAFADIASGVEWVKCDKVARTFPNTLGRRSSALGGSFADVTGAPSDLATGAALMGLLPGGRLRSVGRLRPGLGLAVLTGGVLNANGKCECKERDEWFWECGSHGVKPLTG